MNFSPNDMTIIQSQYQTKKKCDPDNCRRCPIKNKCDEYMLYLERQMFGNTSSFQDNSNIDISLLINHINDLTQKVTNLSSVIVDLQDIQRKQIIESIKSEISTNKQIINHDVEVKDDIQQELLLETKLAEPQFYNNELDVVKINNELDVVKINDDINNQSDNNTNIKNEIVLVDTKPKNENELLLRTSNDENKLFIEKKTIFGNTKWVEKK